MTRSFARAWLLAGLLFGSGAAAATPTSSRLVEVAPGVSLNVVEAGAPSARPTLVLVPGWRLTASIWSEQIAAFSGDRRVIAVDPRSQGDSTKTAEGDTPEQRARDLHVLLGKLGAGHVVIVGWSQGVQDVAAYVDQFGTAGVDGIVLVDSTISPGAAHIAAAPQQAAEQLGFLPILAEAPRAFSEGMLKAIITRPLSKAELDRLVAGSMKTPTAIAQAMLVADMFGVDRTGAIAKFDRPTLVIASARSAELEDQKRMAAALPHGRIEVVADAGHAVFVDQPQVFDRLVGDFLAGLAGGAG